MALDKTQLKNTIAVGLESLRKKPGGGTTEEFAKIISDAIDVYVKAAKIEDKNGIDTENKIR